MADTTFDDIADIYESLVDWPKRLAYETPFFRTLFARHDVHTVADVACGTGHHAHLFHSWGLTVHASDLSPAMIARAESSFPGSPTLYWSVRSFADPVASPDSFDATVCVGNSLALVPDPATAARAVGQMLTATRPGGIVVIHLLNLQKFPPGPITWQKSLRRTLPRHGDAALVKGVHRTSTHGYVDLVVTPADPAVPPQAHSSELLLLTESDLARMASVHGAKTLEFYGNHEFAPYDRATSPDLILVATK